MKCDITVLSGMYWMWQVVSIWLESHGKSRQVSTQMEYNNYSKHIYVGTGCDQTGGSLLVDWTCSFFAIWELTNQDLVPARLIKFGSGKGGGVNGGPRSHFPAPLFMRIPHPTLFSCCYSTSHVQFCLGAAKFLNPFLTSEIPDPKNTPPDPVHHFQVWCPGWFSSTCRGAFPNAIFLFPFIIWFFSMVFGDCMKGGDPLIILSVST